MRRFGHRVTRQTHVIELDATDVREMLRRRFPNETIPATAAVYVRVPGGGDWSNTKLDVGSDANVIVEWDEIS